MDPETIKLLRARIRRGESVPAEELAAALDSIRAQRIAMIGAKPPKAKASPEERSAARAQAKAAQGRELLEQLFGGGP